MPFPKQRSTARLGTQQRHALAQAKEARGHHHGDLIYAYSPRMDEDVVLRSDLEYGHFLLVESDPTIASADYSPRAKVARMAGDQVATIVDVEVVDLDGAITWREVKSGASLEPGRDPRSERQLSVQRKLSIAWGASHEVFTEAEIYADPLRIRNWNRIVAWLAQAREFPLLEEKREVAAVLKARRRVAFREVLELGEGERAGLYAAALFKLVQAGALRSNLNAVPLSIHSVFTIEGVDP